MYSFLLMNVVISVELKQGLALFFAKGPALKLIISVVLNVFTLNALRAIYTY